MTENVISRRGRHSGAQAVVWLLLAASLATILGAWAFELWGGLAPCPLCLQQRWAYYAAVPLFAIAAVLIGRGHGRLPALLVAAGGLALFAGSVLAAYHAGVEWKWWPGPTACSEVDLLAPGASVLPDLSSARVVRCDEAPWRLFGISLAGYNVLISLALAALAAWTARQLAAR